MVLPVDDDYGWFVLEVVSSAIVVGAAVRPDLPSLPPITPIIDVGSNGTDTIRLVENDSSTRLSLLLVHMAYILSPAYGSLSRRRPHPDWFHLAMCCSNPTSSFPRSFLRSVRVHLLTLTDPNIFFPQNRSRSRNKSHHGRHNPLTTHLEILFERLWRQPEHDKDSPASNYSIGLSRV
jgi:hypothetical protein